MHFSFNSLNSFHKIGLLKDLNKSFLTVLVLNGTIIYSEYSVKTSSFSSYFDSLAANNLKRKSIGMKQRKSHVDKSSEYESKQYNSFIASNLISNQERLTST